PRHNRAKDLLAARYRELFQDSQLAGLEDRLAPRPHRQLAVDRLEVRSDGVVTQPQGVADLPGAKPLGGELEHSSLALGEAHGAVDIDAEPVHGGSPVQEPVGASRPHEIDQHGLETYQPGPGWRYPRTGVAGSKVGR